MIAVSHHAQGVCSITIDQFGCRNDEVKEEDIDQDLFYGGIGIHGPIIVHARGKGNNRKGGWDRVGIYL